MVGSVLSDCYIKKEPDYSGVNERGISREVKCKDIETDVRKKDECPASDQIKLERNFDDTIDIKYENFEYDFQGHTFGEDHTIHPNGVFPHTSTQSLVENISMEVCNVKNLDTDLVAVEKKTISGERRIVCNICHKSFPRVFTLNCHIRSVHMKEKPFSCDICHKSFSVKAVLSQHVKSVHERDICQTIFL